MLSLVLFDFERCFNMSGLAGSSWFTRPQRLSRHCRSACKYNRASLCHSFPHVFHLTEIFIVDSWCLQGLPGVDGQAGPKGNMVRILCFFFLEILRSPKNQGQWPFTSVWHGSRSVGKGNSALSLLFLSWLQRAEAELAMTKSLYACTRSRTHGPIVHPVSWRVSMWRFNEDNRSSVGRLSKPTRRLWPLSHWAEKMSSC